MHARKENGRATWTRPVLKSTTMDPAGARTTTLDGHSIRSTKSDASKYVSRPGLPYKATVALLHQDRVDAHDCRSAG